ncbi:MAG: hypothetical protein CL935_05380 [Deltaproteobacteria bacterium]|nr:hypothetical protein [Deltaproteobacteria bacterium]
MFKPAVQNSFRATLMMIAASSLIGMTAILAKTLGQGFNGESLHPLQISAGRFGFALLALLIFLIIKRYKFEKPHYILHFYRSVIGWIGVTCMFTAVTFIPVPDAISISFLNPVLAMFLAFLILKERIGVLRWSATGIALAGSIILLRPGFDSFQLGALIAFAAAFCFGIEVILIKKLSGMEDSLQILSINNTIGFAISVTAASFVWVYPSERQWIELVALGVIMVSAQALFIQAMRSSDASYVLPFSYLSLVFATIYDFFIFKSQPDWISYLGAFTIFSGALVLGVKGYYEYRQNLVRP